MKINNKFILVILIIPLIFLNLFRPVSAISRYMYEYYRLDDKNCILVYYYYKKQPSDYDFISVFTYKENPKYNVLSSVCRGKYIGNIRDTLFYDKEIYLQNGYLFSNTKIFDVKSEKVVIGSVTRADDNEMNPLVYQKMLELGISKEDAQKFNIPILIPRP